MIKVTPTTKEQLIYYLLQNINLGTYDKRFLENITVSYVDLKKPLTSNQANLLDKVAVRYHRQLAKLEMDSTKLVKLPWSIQPIESLPQYTEVHLDLIDDTLVLRCPYKKEFVTQFKKNEIGAQWDSESRFWYIQASTHNLKIINQQLIKHYSHINYCQHLTDFFDSLIEYQNCKHWNPTYKYLSGNFMVVSTNQWLDEALKDISFDDSLYTLSQLARHGVEIDKSVIDLCNTKYDPVLVDFATKTNTEIELNDLDIVYKLISSGVDYVLLYYKLSRGNFVKQIVDFLTKNNISYHIHEQHDIMVVPSSTYKNPVIITDRNVSQSEKEITKMFAKIIKTVNSKPINIK
jgi:hypothetical protein